MDTNYKGQLQTIVSRKDGTFPEYSTTISGIPPCTKAVSRVKVGKKTYVGRGQSKKQAEQDAARKAVSRSRDKKGQNERPQARVRGPKARPTDRAKRGEATAGATAGVRDRRRDMGRSVILVDQENKPNFAGVCYTRGVVAKDMYIFAAKGAPALEKVTKEIRSQEHVHVVETPPGFRDSADIGLIFESRDIVDRCLIDACVDRIVLVSSDRFVYVLQMLIQNYGLDCTVVTKVDEL